MKKISISQFKAKCLGLLEELHQQKQKIIVTKWGKPLVEIRAIDEEESSIPLKDTLIFIGDIVSPIAEEDWEILK